MLFKTSDKPVSTKHEKHGKIGTLVEFPQFSSFDDFREWAKSETNALEFINLATENAAKSAARYQLSNAAETDKVDAILERARKASHDFSVEATARGITGKEAKDILAQALELLQSGNEVSKEDLLALMQKSK